MSVGPWERQKKQSKTQKETLTGKDLLQIRSSRYNLGNNI